MQGEAACGAGEPSGQGEEPPPERLGGHDPFAQTDPRCPTGQVMRHHLYREPVQTAPSALQSVVTGKTTVTAAAEPGVTVMVHPMLLPWVIRLTLFTVPPQGIKVLSLFFIDAVDRYRRYGEDGNQVKGDYALMFEEEYRRLANHPDYHTLFQGVDLSKASEEVHNGYFSIDKKGS